MQQGTHKVLEPERLVHVTCRREVCRVGLRGSYRLRYEALEGESVTEIFCSQKYVEWIFILFHADGESAKDRRKTDFILIYSLCLHFHHAN